MSSQFLYRRRGFIAILGSATASLLFAPFASRAQQVRLVVQAERDAQVQSNVAMFQCRLAELGWVEDRNTRFEHRYADGDPERMRTRLKPDVILAQNTPMVAVLRQQTTTIPIVFVSVSDPVRDGFCREPGAARWQRDGVRQHDVLARRQVGRTVERSRARRVAGGLSVQPGGRAPRRRLLPTARRWNAALIAPQRWLAVTHNRPPVAPEWRGQDPVPGPATRN
jgi:hypothetical protein